MKTGRSFLLLSSLAAVVAVNAACSVERTSSSLAPSSVNVAASTTSASKSLIGTWVSANTLSTAAITALVPLSSCGNFQWNITSQTATAANGTFVAVCPGYNVAGTIVAQLGGATIPLVFTGLATQGSDTCAFTMNGVGTPLSADTYKIAYTGTSCLGPIQGTETLRIASTTPSTTPNTPATPTAPAAPTAPAGAVDQVDLHSAAVYGGGPDIASWPITTAITAIDINSSGVALAFSKKDGAGRWPDVTPPGWDGGIEYTLWLVVYTGGRLVTAGGIEYWHGLERSGGPPSQIAQNWYYSPAMWGPLSSHQPAVGEQVGFFVTAGDQRAKDVRVVTERSNVVIVRFPGDAGGHFTF
jgi:hypothetical protein